MKKIISAFLALTMIVAMVAAISVSSSAADANALIRTYAEAQDGDKLIDIVFGQTTGVYQPIMFGNHESVTDACYETKNPIIEISADGKQMTMNNDDLDEEGDQCGNLQYGGKIDGLKAGKDADGNNYKYTYVLKAKFQHDNCDHKHAGIYFCLNENLITYKDETGRTIMRIDGNTEGHTGAFGWWGHPYKSNNKTEMRYHVIKKDGATCKNLTSSLSDDFKAAMKAGAGEWYDILVEVDGYKMNISFNGTELGWYDFTTDATKINGESTDLAFVTRLFNEDMTYSVKDVAIYKGIDLTSFNDAPPAAPETGDVAVYFVVIAVVSVLGVAMVAKKRANH